MCVLVEKREDTARFSTSIALRRPERDERVALLESISDGLRLAEEDLKLRGPGDYFGTRQSGLPALKQARLTDVDILQNARADADAVLAADPQLTGAELAGLRARVLELAARAGEAN